MGYPLEPLLEALNESGQGYLIVEGERVLHANEACARICGRDPQGLSTLGGWLGLFAPEERNTLRERLRRPAGDGGNETSERTFEGTVVRADGREVAVEVAVGSFPVDGRDRLVVLLRDVTRRKRVEERLRFQARLLDAVGQAVVAVDLEGRIVYWNHAAEELYGWTAEETVGRPASEVMVPEDRQGPAEGIWIELAAGRSWSGEFVVRRRDGSTIPVMVTDTPVRDDQGNLVGVIGVSLDVTERRAAGEALREGEERYRAVVEQTAEGIYLLDVDTGRILEANAAFGELLGYAPEELPGMAALDFVTQDLEELEENIRRTLEEKRRFVGERRYRRKDGSSVDVEVNVSVVHYGGRDVICAAVRDTTERKRAEEALRLRDRAIAESRDGVVITGPGERDHPIVYVNRGFERMTGYAAEELLGRNCRILQGPEGDQPVLEGLRAALREGREWTGVLRNRRNDGAPFLNELSVSPVRDEGGSVTHFVGIMNDVTERAEAEERLRDSEARLAAAQRVARLGSWEWDLGTGEISWSDEVYRIYGRAPGEFVPTFEDLVEDVHPDDRGTFEKARDALHRGEPYDLDHRVVHPDGQVRVVHCRAEVVSDEGGAPLRVVATVHDVTERRRAEAALRESEARFRVLAQNASDVISVLEVDGTVRYHSQALERVLGYQPEEMVGKDAFEHVHPHDAPAARSIFVGIVGRGAPTVAARFRYRHADGSWRHVEAVGRNLLADPSVGGVVVTSRDVTERVRAEEALRESERRFRQFFENSADALLVHDKTGRMVDCNAEACRSLGYSKEELLSLSVKDYASNLLSVEERVRRERDGGTLWQRALAGDPEVPTSFHLGEHRRKDGTTFPVEVRVGGVDYGGERMILAAARDVTERERAAASLRESEARFRTVVESMGEGLLITDLEDVVLYANPRMSDLSGYAAGEMLGRPAYELLLPPERWPEMLKNNRRRSKGAIERYEMWLKRKDGTEFWAQVNASPYRDASGGIVGTVGVNADVTERRRAEEELRKGRTRLAEAQRIARLGSWEYDVDRDEAVWSDEMYRIFGHDPRGPVPSYKIFLKSVHPEDRKLLLRKVRKALREGRHYGHSAEFRLVRPSGETRTVHARYEVIREDAAGRPVDVTGTLQDVTERKALEERLEHQAFHDPLTGLANRALFASHLEHAVARGERQGKRVAVLFLDLDNFKYVNDSLGHDAGDRLLAAAAGRIRGCVRPGDTVARLGGDEFAVLLEGTGDPGEATRVAQRAVEALRGPFDLGGREVFSGTSVGIALTTDGGRPEDLLRKADLALYDAKRGGKARHAWFDPETERRSMRRLELENDLRRALERDELVVHYQPLVSLQTGRVVGFEALVRWERPERGLVLPNEFVPLAEENGLIVPLGRWVLREACRRAREWQEGRPPDVPPPIVGVNLSARQLSHPGLVGDVRAVLREHGLPPDRLTLEVTESALVEGGGRHADALEGLKKLGVRFAIDDFGTGYSSLSYLRRLPAGLVKLDGSFVTGIGKEGGEDEVLLEGVVGIARGLGLGVCAEGVETPEQAARLRGLGCDQAQGHHFSAPLTGEEAAAFLEAGSRE